MDPTKILAEVNTILGAKNSLIPPPLLVNTTAQKKRTREHQPKRSIKDEFAFYVASKVMTHFRGNDRILGKNEKIRVQPITDQIIFLLDEIAKALLGMNESGIQFRTKFAEHYQRSIVNVKAEEVTQSAGDRDHFRCIITQSELRLPNARIVTVTHRVSGGAIMNATPFITSKEWAERMIAWPAIVLLNERIVTEIEKIIQTPDLSEIEIAVKVSQKEEILNELLTAIKIWIPKRVVGCWKEWWN